ncbi:MAG: hypothetical protein R3F13_11220 [Prosthecobacter sp.]
MPAKPHSQEQLIFAWHAKDHSTWHLAVALLILAAVMAGFFFVFRIVHPVTHRIPTTPQHVISLDPRDPAALALINRAQDRSFAVLVDSQVIDPQESALLAFRPSFEGHRLKLREIESVVTEMTPPLSFTPGVGVLPPVSRRATGEVPPPPRARLAAVMSPNLAKRGPASVELPPGIALSEPVRVQFRVAVGSAGQIITALPLGGTEDPEVMKQLLAAINALRFDPSDVTRVEWGGVSFRWEVAQTP